MSTREELNRLWREKRVFHVPPAVLGTSSRRHVFLEASIHERLQTAIDGSSKDDVRLTGLYADIERFTSGSRIMVGADPFEKDHGAFMARTHPVQEGIFDIRSIDPSPALRLFGAFCERDVFLGLTWRWRRELGGKHEKTFDHAVLQARKMWDELMPNHQPLYSERMEDYISEKLSVV